VEKKNTQRKGNHMDEISQEEKQKWYIFSATGPKLDISNNFNIETG
jgi:hypothetical protein